MNLSSRLTIAMVVAVLLTAALGFVGAAAGGTVGAIIGAVCALGVTVIAAPILTRPFAKMAAASLAEAATVRQELEEGRRIFNTSVDLILVTDRQGNIVRISPSSEATLGYRPEEMIGRSAGDFIYQDDLDPTRNEMRSARRGRAVRNFESRYVHKDGRVVMLEWAGVWSEQAQQHFFIGRDMTEQRRAEAEIRKYAEREQLFIAAVESSNDAIVTKTLDGIITGWNQAAERLFGYSAEEVVGRSINVIVPEELRGDVRMILDRIKSGDKVEHHETERIRKDGTRIEVSLSVSPLKSQAGTIIGAAKVARDISARRQAERERDRNRDFLNSVVENITIAVLVKDARTLRYVLVNKAAEQLWGVPREAVIGKTPREIFDSATADMIEANDQQVLDSKSHFSVGEHTLQTPGNGARLVTTNRLAICDHLGEVQYVLGVVDDVTERRTVENQLRQSQKMETIGQLTGGIAHDFNNMLTVITGTIDILADAVKDKPELGAITKLISEAADRGAELTGQLLAFARKQPLQPREIDINALMVESEKLLRRTLGEQIDIKLRLQEDAWPALIDPGQLTTALLNLAVNARDAMPDGSKLTLETGNVVLDEGYVNANREAQPGDYVMVAVSDTGQGIPKAMRQRVFEPFFTTKEVGKGTGLGLSMVYGFVKQSGGHIKLYSEEGVGTTIKVYLPRANAQAGQVTHGADEAEMQGGTETILIVEDDDLVRTSVTTQLQSLGYTTLAAANAAEALAIADTGAAFDLLFTDVIMPGRINGRELAEEIAKRCTPLKVLFTSGYTENAIIHHGRLDSGVHLLAKPYRKGDLARMVRRAIDGSEALYGRREQLPQAQAM